MIILFIFYYSISPRLPIFTFHMRFLRSSIFPGDKRIRMIVILDISNFQYLKEIVETILVSELQATNQTNEP